MKNKVKLYIGSRFSYLGDVYVNQCPLCSRHGGKSSDISLEYGRDIDNDEGLVYIYCEECGIEGKTIRFEDPDELTAAFHEAVKWWNDAVFII